MVKVFLRAFSIKLKTYDVKIYLLIIKSYRCLKALAPRVILVLDCGCSPRFVVLDWTTAIVAVFPNLFAVW